LLDKVSMFILASTLRLVRDPFNFVLKMNSLAHWPYLAKS
jgi:hypothetical protein